MEFQDFYDPDAIHSDYHPDKEVVIEIEVRNAAKFGTSWRYYSNDDHRFNSGGFKTQKEAAIAAALEMQQYGFKIIHLDHKACVGYESDTYEIMGGVR